jgi:hypothetical protein
MNGGKPMKYLLVVALGLGVAACSNAAQTIECLDETGATVGQRCVQSAVPEATRAAAEVPAPVEETPVEETPVEETPQELTPSEKAQQGIRGNNGRGNDDGGDPPGGGNTVNDGDR